MIEEINKLVVFHKKEIRRQLHGGEWWFSITDVVAVLTDSSDPARYLRNLRARDSQLAELFKPVDKGGSQIETPLNLPFETLGGKQKVPCWNTEGIFRLIQSIPSKKAEPFKRCRAFH
jgi:DNA-damage-inducible protein D